MKRLGVGIIIMTFFILSQVTSVAYGYTLTVKDTHIIDTVNSKIQKIVDTKGIRYKSKISKLLEKVLIKLPENTRKYEIIKNILEYTNTIPETGNVISNNFPEYGFSIDREKIRKTWLDWQNGVRKKLGKQLYSYDSRLDTTAQEWSETATSRGYINHKRDTGDSYYDYSKIAGWMKDRGVVCKNISRTTYSESIGSYWFHCNETDCTDEALIAAKDTFDYYMSEKGLPYPQNAHYKGITNTHFSKIGMGLDVQSKGGGNYVLYMTTHYCSELM